MKDNLWWILVGALLMLAGYRWMTRPQPSLGIQMWFERCDLDNNGSISPSEFQSLSSPIDEFQLYDENQDEKIDIIELEALFRSTPPTWISPCRLML